MIDSLSKEFYDKLYHLPPNAKDFKEFGEIVLKKFIDEVKANTQGVMWNSGFDAVIFINKTVDNKKSIDKIKEEFLGQESDVSDPSITQGTGAHGDGEGDSPPRGCDQLSEY